MVVNSKVNPRFGHVPANLPVAPLGLDLHDHQSGYRVHLARADRTIDRFRQFENGPLTPATADALVDDFLAAIETVHHLRDWVKHDLGLKEIKGPLKELLDGEVQRVVADIANGSKHATVDKTRYFTDILHLTTGNGTFSTDDSLADYYAQLRVVAGQREWRPVDLLNQAIADWQSFTFENLDKLNLLRRLSGPES